MCSAFWSFEAGLFSADSKREKAGFVIGSTFKEPLGRTFEIFLKIAGHAEREARNARSWPWRRKEYE